MVSVSSFSDFFQALWRHQPFPWQSLLAERLVNGNWPQALDLPTASGKTACIDIALWALAAQADTPVGERTAPRRIWFVVDRRIVVDEAFDRAREIAAKLREAKGGPLQVVADRLREISGTQRPLAVGRLRGGMLRDDGWARLPSQPAVITSTVDQLGSRLLFRGYGRSSQTAPIFAGLAAHDSLILLDEAHLSVPFMQTLRAVQRYRGEHWGARPVRTPFAFAILSATPPRDIPETAVFPGPDRDAALDHPQLARRIRASKPAELVLLNAVTSPAQDPLVETASQRVIAFVEEERRQRVAVIVNRVRTAEAIAHSLREQSGDEFDIVLLTGRLRPFERDRLVARWKPVLRANAPSAPERPVVLVTTQCIEVGADFSFDALVTEAASLDALRQRFGRLDRLGRNESSPAAILIRDENAKAGSVDFVYGTALAECWRLLYEELAETKTEGKHERRIVDFGIAALDQRLQAIDDLVPYLAPAPDAPLLLPAHLDLLCQTSPRPQVEPDVALYLHGMDRGVPEVRVAWRADLEENRTDLWPEIVSLCPPNSAETVTVPLYRLRRWLADRSEADDGADVEGAREPEQRSGERIRPALVWQGRDRSRVCTRASDVHPNDVVVLPAAYGMTGLAQSAPKETVGESRLDIWEPTHAASGKPVALRLNREVLKPWLECPPLDALLALAEDPAAERDDVQEAIGAMLAYRPQRENDPPAPPAWWLELLDQVRNGRYEQHPAGGLVLRSRMAASQQEVEQDLFADDDDLLSAVGQEVGLAVHSASVERAVEQLARRCLPDEFREPLKTAAWWHDVGKLDERFQVLLRQGDELAALSGEPLAKAATIPDSPARRRAIRAASGLPENFRHEMLSLQLAERYLSNGEDADLADLLLHATASHHGYGRPFAPVCVDAEPPAIRGKHGGVTIAVGTEDRLFWSAPHALDSGISERFWRLTRGYGWWGLAYLEAILRLGDWYGSRWMVEKIPERPDPAPSVARSTTANPGGKSLVLEGIDGANPLGFLAAVGALVVLHQGGHRDSRLAWRRNGLAWRPLLAGLATDDPAALSAVLAEQLRGADISAEAEKKCNQAERLFSAKKKEIKDKREGIKKRGLRGKERMQALEKEVAPLEGEAAALRRVWLDALRQSVPSPELALGKNIDCTESEYRAIVEPLMDTAVAGERATLDLLAAFCSTGCLDESASKRKDGKLAATPFSFISGSGHQDFLDTARELMGLVSPERLKRMLADPWRYEDEGLSMRWDPVEDRRYALMDRDPTASDNKPRTVWMANLLAYRSLVLFPSAPTRRGLATVGWTAGENGEPFFTWALWSALLDPDSIRALLLLPELYAPAPDRAALRTIGVAATFRSRRIKVGTGANFKVNFTPARQL
jgi:CRISPR-associated endonuclease/helicase Cas3